MKKTKLEKIRDWAKKHRKGIRFTFNSLKFIVCSFAISILWNAELGVLTSINIITLGAGAYIGVAIIIMIILSWFVKGWFNTMQGPSELDFMWDEMKEMKDMIAELYNRTND